MGGWPPLKEEKPGQKVSRAELGWRLAVVGVPIRGATLGIKAKGEKEGCLTVEKRGSGRP